MKTKVIKEARIKFTYREVEMAIAQFVADYLPKGYNINNVGIPEKISQTEDNLFVIFCEPILDEENIDAKDLVESGIIKP